MTPRRINILSLGAGVQSTALYLMYHRGGFLDHTIDAAIFADTGDEPQAVYKHLEWLQSLNGPPILIRSKGRLSDDLMRGENSTGQRFAPIPAFTAATGESAGKIRRQCSKEYKIDVIERTIRRDILGLEPRQRIPKHIKITQIIGISLDEAGRAARIERNQREKRSPFSVKFPLIEAFMTRANCLEWLLTHGNVPHETPRSACVFCPYQMVREDGNSVDCRHPYIAAQVNDRRIIVTTEACKDCPAGLESIRQQERIAALQERIALRQKETDRG